jgi:hypothetical protein
MSSSNNSNNHSKSRPGRPRALDHVKQREVIASVNAGFSIDRAARYVGCAPSTIRRECRRNPEFDRDLRRACFSAELYPLQALREAARKYWRAAAWLLERLDPARFGKPRPGYVKPEELEAFTSIFSGIISREVADPKERQRIYDRLHELDKSTQRLLSVIRDTPPRTRSRRRASELTPAARDLLAEIDRAVFGAPTTNGHAAAQNVSQ